MRARSLAVHAAFALILGWLPVCSLQAATPDADTESENLREHIRQRIESIGYSRNLTPDVLPSASLLLELYAHAQYRPLWTSRAKVDQLWAVAGMAEAQGLSTVDYPLADIQRLLPGRGLPRNPARRAELELLATDALIRLASQLRYGKVSADESASIWRFDRPLLDGNDRIHMLAELIAAGSMTGRLSSLFDRGPYYARLVALLSEYRTRETQGGWPLLSEGPTLRLGDWGPRVVELHRRLEAEGMRPAARPEVFDWRLADAVREFQRRHGLQEDGVVGPHTLQALNVNVGDRIGQIRASLERARWVIDAFDARPEALVLVNIASSHVRYLRRWQPVWSGRAVVGQPQRQTPSFRDEIDYLVLNPTWIVPPTILKEDILPAIRREGPRYLERRHMDVLDSEGRIVDPAQVDWSASGADDFGYVIKQRPGPWNMLGRIKFVFPNARFVFMHDTPTPEYFDRTCRALSSGCVRVEGPFNLAELLLADPKRWNQAAFDRLLEQEQPAVVHLPRPVPIILLYATADTDEHGRGYFYDDVYGIDAPLLQALDERSRLPGD